MSEDTELAGPRKFKVPVIPRRARVESVYLLNDARRRRSFTMPVPPPKPKEVSSRKAETCSLL